MTADSEFLMGGDAVAQARITGRNNSLDLGCFGGAAKGASAAGTEGPKPEVTLPPEILGLSPSAKSQSTSSICVTAWSSAATTAVAATLELQPPTCEAPTSGTEEADLKRFSSTCKPLQTDDSQHGSFNTQRTEEGAMPSGVPIVAQPHSAVSQHAAPQQPTQSLPESAQAAVQKQRPSTSTGLPPRSPSSKSSCALSRASLLSTGPQEAGHSEMPRSLLSKGNESNGHGTLGFGPSTTKYNNQGHHIPALPTSNNMQDPPKTAAGLAWHGAADGLRSSLSCSIHTKGPSTGLGPLKSHLSEPFSGSFRGLPQAASRLARMYAPRGMCDPVDQQLLNKHVEELLDSPGGDLKSTFSANHAMDVDPEKPEEGWMAANLCHRLFTNDPLPVSVPKMMVEHIRADLGRIRAKLMQHRKARTSSSTNFVCGIPKEIQRAHSAPGPRPRPEGLSGFASPNKRPALERPQDVEGISIPRQSCSVITTGSNHTDSGTAAEAEEVMRQTSSSDQRHSPSVCYTGCCLETPRKETESYLMTPKKENDTRVKLNVMVLHDGLFEEGGMDELKVLDFFSVTSP